MPMKTIYIRSLPNPFQPQPEELINIQETLLVPIKERLLDLLKAVLQTETLFLLQMEDLHILIQSLYLLKTQIYRLPVQRKLAR
jgi:hypothetical protein